MQNITIEEALKDIKIQQLKNEIQELKTIIETQRNEIQELKVKVKKK